MSKDILPPRKKIKIEWSEVFKTEYNEWPPQVCEICENTKDGWEFHPYVDLVLWEKASVDIRKICSRCISAPWRRNFDFRVSLDPVDKEVLPRAEAVLHALKAEIENVRKRPVVNRKT